MSFCITHKTVQLAECVIFPDDGSHAEDEDIADDTINGDDSSDDSDQDDDDDDDDDDQDVRIPTFIQETPHYFGFTV